MSVQQTRDTWWDQWWLESDLYAVSNKGKTKPTRKLATLYSLLWQPQNLPAWAYELARRLPKIQATLNREDSDYLGKLPPYPQLDSTQKKHLIHGFKEIDRPLILTAHHPKTKGYSEPIQPMRFRLDASDKALKKLFIEWIKHQRCSAAERDSSAIKHPNSHDPDRIVNWRMVAMLDHQPRGGIVLGPVQKKLRADGKRLGLEFLPLVLKIMKTADLEIQSGDGALHPANIPSPKLIPRRKYSIKQVEDAVNKVISNRKSPIKG